jgi:hypothetical protein
MNRLPFLPLKNSILAILATLFVVGCGSSSSSVGNTFAPASGGNSSTPPPIAGGGGTAVVFNFVKAQAPLTVPNETATIELNFLDGPDGTGTVVQTESRDFAPQIIIDPVAAASRSVVVTARSAEGYPLLEATAAINESRNDDFTVDFANATIENITITDFFISPPSATIPAGATNLFTANLVFSNDEVLPANNVTWSATGQVGVDANGLATASTDGVGTVTATRNGSMSTANVIVGVGQVLTTITVVPVNPNVNVGRNTLQLSAMGYDQNGVSMATGTLTWSDDSTTSSVDPASGLFTSGFINETVIVTATGDGGVMGTTTVSVIGGPGGPIGPIGVAPTIVLDPLMVGDLSVDQITGQLIAPDGTVADDSMDLDGGSLTLTLTGTATDGAFTVDGGAPMIGTVMGLDSNMLTVGPFNPGVTPAQVQDFLRLVRLTAGETTGTGTVNAMVSDGGAVPLTGTDTRDFTVVNTLVIDAMDPTNPIILFNTDNGTLQNTTGSGINLMPDGMPTAIPGWNSTTNTIEAEALLIASSTRVHCVGTNDVRITTTFDITIRGDLNRSGNIILDPVVGQRGADGGKITLTAGRDINVPTGRLLAAGALGSVPSPGTDGGGNGGNVMLMATRDINYGGDLLVRGSSRMGNGGTATLRAERTLTTTRNMTNVQNIDASGASGGRFGTGGNGGDVDFIAGTVINDPSFEVDVSGETNGTFQTTILP